MPTIFTAMALFMVSCTMVNAQPVHPPDWKVGKSTYAAAIDITNENTIVAGARNGGVWRTADGGLHWTKGITIPAGDDLWVNAVVQDTRPGFRHVWYYGVFDNSSKIGATIFKSIDGAQTWKPIEASSGISYIHTLAVHPQSGNLYAAAYDGLHRFTPETDSVERILYGGEFGEFTNVMITPAGVVYAAFDQHYCEPTEGYECPEQEAARGVLRSDDETTWTNITPPELVYGPWAPYFYQWSQVTMDYAPSNEHIVYVVFNPDFNLEHALAFQYTDTASGEKWKPLTIPPYEMGLYHSWGMKSVVKVHPTNPGIVFFGASDNWSMNLYRSTNGFHDENEIDLIGGYRQPFDTIAYPNHHPGQHGLLFFPSNPNSALSLTDGGIYKTENILSDTVQWVSLNNSTYQVNAKQTKAPKALPAEKVSPVYFTARWTAVENADYYILDLSSDDFKTFVARFHNRLAKDTSIFVKSVTPRLTYKYRVRAVNENDTSAYSNVMVVAKTRTGDFYGVCSDQPSIERRWKIYNPNPFDITVKWNWEGSSTCQVITIPSGNSFFTTPFVPKASLLTLTWTDDWGIQKIHRKKSVAAPCPTKIISVESRQLTIKTWPNPARDKIEVDIETQHHEPVYLQLTDAVGTMRLNQTQQANTNQQIDLSHLGPGIYLLKARQGTNQQTLRIIKQ